MTFLGRQSPEGPRGGVETEGSKDLVGEPKKGSEILQGGRKDDFRNQSACPVGKQKKKCERPRVIYVLRKSDNKWHGKKNRGNTKRRKRISGMARPGRRETVKKGKKRKMPDTARRDTKTKKKKKKRQATSFRVRGLRRKVGKKKKKKPPPGFANRIKTWLGGRKKGELENDKGEQTKERAPRRRRLG